MNEYGSLKKQNAATALWHTSMSISHEKTKKEQGRIFTVLLFAFVVIFLLALLAVGVQAYSAINDSREQSDDSRLGLSLIANNIRMNDRIGAIGVGKGPEGDSLVLTENLESGSFETRIYLYQGQIVEEYSQANKAYTPERARGIVPSEQFEFAYSAGIITVYTDRGSVDMALRSIGGS